MDLTSRAGQEAQSSFLNEVESLRGEALLKKKAAFDQLPDALEDERFSIVSKFGAR
jgi:hypothetical protein